MKYYSTNGGSASVDLKTAVVNGLAEDGGLYMPERIGRLPDDFFRNIQNLSFQEIALRVAKAFFAEDIPESDLRHIVEETLTFDCPIVKVEENIYSLELFHGPTLAFKDVGARFMARMLQHFLGGGGETVNVLVATSGDTGSAVANGFLGVEGIRVFVLYPKGKVSPIQECQFTTLGQNITAIEVDGVFDDCQALVKQAFVDQELKGAMKLTSANSINLARLLPQSFYYFNAYARMKQLCVEDNLIVCVPSGNFGNICSALIGRRMGLPVARFIAANNRISVFYEFLQSGEYIPRHSIQTIANAMDVGAPSNFARIWDLYGKDWKAIRADISGYVVDDDTIMATIADCFSRTGYVLDPHGACGYKALSGGLQAGETGIFCETAHPAKFKETVERAIGEEVRLPARLEAFTKGKKQSVELPARFNTFKSFLLEQ